MQVQYAFTNFVCAFASSTLALLHFGCAQMSPNEHTAHGSAPVVYGSDNRVELGDSTHPAARLFQSALVALIPKTRLHELPSGEKELRTATLGVAQNLCPGERFTEQPSAAECSGTLASNGLVLTARHCVTSLEHCRSLVWAFDYALLRGGELAPFAAEDTYECKGVVAADYDSVQGIDYAWIELDRPVVGRQPMEIPRLSAPLVSGSLLLAAGFGQGLPAKLDPEVLVLALHGTYFTAVFDSFNGSSGMPVLTPNGTWVGFALRGEADYESVGGCRRARVLGPNCEGCVFGGERVAHVSTALDGLRAAQALNAEVTATQEEIGAPTLDAGGPTDPERVEEAAPPNAEVASGLAPSTASSTSSEYDASATGQPSQGPASCAFAGARSLYSSALRSWALALAVSVVAAMRVRRRQKKTLGRTIQRNRKEANL